jgi:hypothetical protein
MIRYDDQVLQKFAEKLYARANSIIAAWSLVGLIAAGVGGAFIVMALDSSSRLEIIAIAAVLGAIFGFVMGSSKAFLLKLQAQQALCQRQIELNTRPTPDSSIKT